MKKNEQNQYDLMQLTKLTTTLQGVKTLAKVMMLLLARINDTSDHTEGDIQACDGIGTLLEKAVEIHGIPAIAPIFKEVEEQWCRENPRNWIPPYMLIGNVIADNLCATNDQILEAEYTYDVFIGTLGDSPEWIAEVHGDVAEYYSDWTKISELDEAREHSEELMSVGHDWASEGF